MLPKATGRPGYDPADLLKLYIYGYLNRVRSSRRLEAETHRNIEVIWLLRGLKPDFKTIADFRRNNRAAFRSVFRAFVLLCRQLDLFGRELLAVDGTRIKAVTNKDRNFTRAALTKFIQQADEKLAGYLQALDTGDADEDGSSGGQGPSRKGPRLAEKIAAVRGKRERHRALLEELDRTGEEQISLTDPDSRAMARMTKVGVGYNVQVAVDVKHKLIVEQEVHSQVVDMGLLAPTATAAMEALGVGRIEAVADRGYFKIEDIEACEAAGITPYVPKPVRGSAVREGFSPRSSSALTRRRTPSPALATRSSGPAGVGSHGTTSRSTTATGKPVWPASSDRAAPRPTGTSHAWRTRPCSTAWPCGWLPAPRFSISAAPASSTRSARSSNGCTRAPS